MSLSLEQLRIESPCSVDLSKMPGDDRRRFCDHCQKHVHNLSAMTRGEAMDLVCQSAGDLCVQFQRDPVTQTVITLDYAPPRRRRWPFVAAMLTLATLGGLVVRKVLGKPAPLPPPPPVMVAGGLGMAFPGKLAPMPVNTTPANMTPVAPSSPPTNVQVCP